MARKVCQIIGQMVLLVISTGETHVGQQTVNELSPVEVAQARVNPSGHVSVAYTTPDVGW